MKKTWTESEIDILRTHYRTNDRKARKKLQNLLKDRSWDQIKDKAGQLGLRVSFRWRQSEDDFIRNNYNKHSVKYLKKYLEGRSLGAIQQRIIFLNCTKRLRNYWTQNENEVLKQHYEYLSTRELERKLKYTHTRRAIQTQADALGLVKRHKKNKRLITYFNCFLNK